MIHLDIIKCIRQYKEDIQKKMNSLNTFVSKKFINTIMKLTLMVRTFFLAKEYMSEWLHWKRKMIVQNTAHISVRCFKFSRSMFRYRKSSSISCTVTMKTGKCRNMTLISLYKQKKYIKGRYYTRQMIFCRMFMDYYQISFELYFFEQWTFY